MPFCENCGTLVGDSDAVCKNCGSPLRNARRTVPAPAPIPVYHQDIEPPKGSPYAVLSSWGFVGSILLMSLPIAGFIIMIVWAANGTVNHNRRNLARGYLLVLAIAAAVYLLIVIWAIIVFGSVGTLYGDLWNL